MYSINQSVNHSPSFFDAPGTEAFASEQEPDPDILQMYMHIRNEASRSRFSKVGAQTGQIDRNTSVQIHGTSEIITCKVVHYGISYQKMRQLSIRKCHIIQHMPTAAAVSFTSRRSTQLNRAVHHAHTMSSYIQFSYF